MDCLYANYVNGTSSGYAAHLQLARVLKPAIGGDPNAAGSTNASFETLDEGYITVVPVPPPGNLEDYFAGGPGQIHIYGLATPFVLYP